MAIHLYDSGAQHMLDLAFNGVTTTGYKLILFTNNFVPGPATESTQIYEALGANYVRINVGVGTEGDTSIVGGISTMTWLTYVFPSTSGDPDLPTLFNGALTAPTGGSGSVVVYGYALLKGTAAACNATTGAITMDDVVFADAFINPFTPANGNSLSLDIVFQLGYGTPVA